MKRRFLALFCALTLLFSLLLALPAQAAYQGVYLIGFNDTLLLGLINKDKMPVVRSNVLYVHHTALDNNDLGLSYALNKTDGTFTIYNRQKTLIFPTTGAGAYDKEGNEYTNRIINRNGKVYIPIRFVATFFGLAYSAYTLTLPDGTVPIARVCNDDAGLDDQQFGASAAQLAAQPLREYMAAQATPTPTPTPSQPAPSQSVPSQAPPEPVTAYLAVACTDGTGFAQLCRTLERYQVSVLFLFPADQLVLRAADVRRAAAAGHQIGLLLPQEDAQAAFDEGNRLLGHILRGHATQAAFAQGDGEVENCQVWRTDVQLRGRSAAARVQNLLADLGRYDVAQALLDDSDLSARTLEAAMPALAQAPYTLRTPTETDPMEGP